MQTVYVETTIPSYLAAHPSKQEPMASHQKLTREWWDQQRRGFLLYSSIFVSNEAARGDASAAQRRATYLAGIPLLDVPDALDQLRPELIRLFQLPPKAETDALHLGMAILHRMDYLLTWNCTHLANATLLKDLFQYCQSHGLHYPIICTPENLCQLHP